MKQVLSLLCVFMLFSCNDNSKDELNKLTNEINVLQDSISKLSSSNNNFIEIPLSQLVTLFNSDSLIFNSSIRDLGFYSVENLLYFKNGFKPETKDIGIGHFMFHNIPMLTRAYDVDWLIYTFPINKLSYYKTAILEKGRFTQLYEQESKYIDKYNANYINEIYVDKINKLEYELSFYKSYCKIRISKREY